MLACTSQPQMRTHPHVHEQNRCAAAGGLTHGDTAQQGEVMNQGSSIDMDTYGKTSVLGKKSKSQRNTNNRT